MRELKYKTVIFTSIKIENEVFVFNGINLLMDVMAFKRKSENISIQVWIINPSLNMAFASTYCRGASLILIPEDFEMVLILPKNVKVIIIQENATYKDIKGQIKKYFSNL